MRGRDLEARAGSGPTRVAVVAPVLARYDAISAAARDTWRMLDRAHGFETSVLTYRSDYPEVGARIVNSVSDLLVDSAFLSADVLIYHFGIYAGLFDALLVGNGRARQIVVFHNVTPPHLLPRQRSILEKSLRQVSNLQHADEIWAVSEVNRAALEEYGLDPNHVRVLPLAVEEPAQLPLGSKSRKALEILFVGRFVPSKGALDLLAAARMVRATVDFPFRIHLAGSTEWSDPEYIGKIRKFVAASGLETVVRFDGLVSDGERDCLLREAHILAIPSYHEGFCKPVVEGLRAGCIPIGYDAYNLGAVANGFGRMVPPGNISALADAVIEIMYGLRRGLGERHAPALLLDRGVMTVAEFERETERYVERFAFSRIAAEARSLLRGRDETAEQRVESRSEPPAPSVTKMHPDARDCPALGARHLESARLFADRADLISSIGIGEHGVIGEVGVAVGDFSAILLDRLKPALFVAFDLFELHLDKALWGLTTEEIFGNDTHLAFYQRRFQSRGRQVVTEKGPSHETLAKYPDRFFDMLYIDAGHDFESVKRDAELAVAKIRPSGILVFNDYIMFDHVTATEYGIVPVVNTLVVREDWQVLGIALQRHMFCDIAIQRRAGSGRS